MPLPANTPVRIAQSFVRDVRAAGDFMHRQDATTADDRYEGLRVRIAEARRLVSWNPESGRPARFLEAQSIHALAVAEEARSLMQTTALPMLRELIIKPYILLYAHNREQVILLGLRRERQQAFPRIARD